MLMDKLIKLNGKATAVKRKIPLQYKENYKKRKENPKNTVNILSVNIGLNSL